MDRILASEAGDLGSNPDGSAIFLSESAAPGNFRRGGNARNHAEFLAARDVRKTKITKSAHENAVPAMTEKS